MKGLLAYFARGTGRTRTGRSMGAEIETHLVSDDGTPIDVNVTNQLMATPPPGPWRVSHDLGRQLIELSLDPQLSPAALIATAQEALDWLYRRAASYGARPLFAPELEWSGDLLLANDIRDQVWVNLDSRTALEQLCRVASVQFTVSVAPDDAIPAINRLWAAQLHQLDYPNDLAWRTYIAQSRARYHTLRYGGPEGFTDLADYAQQLSHHPVVMLRGQACQSGTGVLKTSADYSLYVRSVWWHHRLRRYGNVLALETRPYARRTDAAIVATWWTIANALGL